MAVCTTVLWAIIAPMVTLISIVNYGLRPDEIELQEIRRRRSQRTM